LLVQNIEKKEWGEAMVLAMVRLLVGDIKGRRLVKG
jgi:hypothetical protein